MKSMKHRFIRIPNHKILLPIAKTFCSMAVKVEPLMGRYAAEQRKRKASSPQLPASYEVKRQKDGHLDGDRKNSTVQVSQKYSVPTFPLKSIASVSRKHRVRDLYNRGSAHLVF